MNVREHEVTIAIDSRLAISGTMCLPASPSGMVILVQAAAASRKLPRERLIATVQQRAGFATLILDLLTEREAESERFGHPLRFDVPLLAGRLILSTLWLRRQPETHALPIGFFASNTAAAAALVAAAHEPDRIRAIVARSGRADLAGECLGEVRSPTLLIVGSADVPVLAATRQALPRLSCEKHVEVVPGATHLFEQPGALELAAFKGRDWFSRHLASRPTPELVSGPSSRRTLERVRVVAPH